MKPLLKSLFFVVLLTSNWTFAQQKTEEERMTYAQQMLEQALLHNDSAQLAEAYYLLAKRHAAALNAEQAYQLYYQALTLNDQLKNHYKAGKIYLRMAGLELKQRHFERARTYAQTALDRFEEHNLPKGIRAAYRLLGETYFVEISDLDNSDVTFNSIPLDSAIYYTRKAEEVAKIIGDEKKLAGIRLSFGRLYLKRGDKKALEYLEYAVNTYQKHEQGTSTINSRTALAKAWLTFGSPDNASEILEGSQKIIDSNDGITLAAKASHHTLFSKYYKTIGEWKQALSHREIATRIYDQIAKAERNQNLSKWRVRLETEKKELELKLRNRELANQEKIIAQQQLFILLSTFFLLALALLSYFLYKNYKKQQWLSRKNAFLIKEQNHRVKNNLQVISSIISLQQEHLSDLSSRSVLSESQARIDSVVLLHRQLYENNDFELIDMEKLFDDIIQSVAFTFGKGQVHAELELKVKYLEPDTATSVGVIVNELVMNSFKHAFENRPPYIEITTTRRRGCVEITYKDFGKSNQEEIFKNRERKGFGLQLIDMILHQINGKLTYKYEGGSVFTFSFCPPPADSPVLAANQTYSSK